MTYISIDEDVVLDQHLRAVTRVDARVKDVVVVIAEGAMGKRLVPDPLVRHILVHVTGSEA